MHVDIQNEDWNTSFIHYLQLIGIFRRAVFDVVDLLGYDAV